MGCRNRPPLQRTDCDQLVCGQDGSPKPVGMVVTFVARETACAEVEPSVTLPQVWTDRERDIYVRLFCWWRSLTAAFRVASVVGELTPLVPWE